MPLLPLAAMIATLYFIRGVFVPLAFAILLSFLLVPLVSALQRLKLGRLPAAAITVLLALGVVGGVGWVVVVEMLDLASALPAYSTQIHQRFENAQQKEPNLIWRALEGFNNMQSEWTHEDARRSAIVARATQTSKEEKQNPQPTPVTVVPPPAGSLDNLRNIALPVLGPLARAGITIIFACYILVRREDLRNRMFRLAGVSQLNIATRALDDAARRVSRYLRTQLVVNLSFGTIIGVALYFIGVPNSALWGFVAGLFRFVPYAGWIAAAAGPVLLSLALFNHVFLSVGILALYAGLEVIVANAIEPWLYGSHTGISPLGLLVAAVFWSVLWGPVGLILSTPLTVCLVVLGRYVPRFSFLHILLADEPMLTPEAHVYQRLLAMDEHEVQQLATTARKQATLADVYDRLLIRTLLMAEQDMRRGDLDEPHQQFIFHTLDGLITELSKAPDEEEGEPKEGEQPPLPAPASTQRIVLVPASGQADVLAAKMLGELLERERVHVVKLSPPKLGKFRSMPGDCFCVVALAPFGLKHAEAVCGRIRRYFRETALFVTILGYGDSLRVSSDRFTKWNISDLTTALPSALESMVQQVTADESPEIYAAVPTPVTLPQ